MCLLDACLECLRTLTAFIMRVELERVQLWVNVTVVYYLTQVTMMTYMVSLLSLNSCCPF
jgi:hypothetical protein